jgi:hypothetical protein
VFDASHLLRLGLTAHLNSAPDPKSSIPSSVSVGTSIEDEAPLGVVAVVAEMIYTWEEQILYRSIGSL